MSERMIIDALPARNNILLGIVATNTGNAVVDAMIRGGVQSLSWRVGRCTEGGSAGMAAGE